MQGEIERHLEAALAVGDLVDITGAARTGTMDLGAFSVVVGSPSVQPRLIITPASVSVPEAGTATATARKIPSWRPASVWTSVSK